MTLKKLTDKQLIEDLQGLHEAIYEADCFGTHDMINYELIVNELHRRGIDIEAESTLSFMDSTNGELVERFDKKGKAIRD